MSAKNIALTNIQRFSLHDGPGIRTTVFMSGCSLRCSWCSNPENVYSCRAELYDPESLALEVLKDRAFYNPGGVTFSGGEALLQIDALVPVLEILERENVHTAVETCLYVPPENLALAMKHIDLFYVDVKILDREEASSILHGNLDLYLENLDALMHYRSPEGRRKSVVLRVPVIGRFTDGSKNREAVKNLIVKYSDGIQKVELIKEHNLGAGKYRSLGLAVPGYFGVSDELMTDYREYLKEAGVPVEICKV